MNSDHFVKIMTTSESLRASSTLKHILHSFGNLTKEQKLIAFKHNGFWHPMDTLRDKKHLEDLWTSEKAPWKIW